jgi:hypothetical protein
MRGMRRGAEHGETGQTRTVQAMALEVLRATVQLVAAWIVAGEASRGPLSAGALVSAW